MKTLISEKAPSHEDIARRAQEIWEEEGRPEGKAQEHWLQAERELSNSKQDGRANSRARGRQTASKS